ncbi:MAG TPA: KH domain-containing protein [Xanthomonadales bacterium]|nr:KH domain-containing protein [Xanthomonadales bacterium]
MSAFDDEFGLFGDDDKPVDEERTSTLGARRIASDEAAHDDIEPEDERPRRGPRNDRRDRTAGGTGAVGGADGERRPRREYGGDRGARKTEDPAVAQKRALDLLGFLARKLVSRPENVLVEEVETEKGPVVELVVEHEDLGKVIGRSGRVAQALRTLVRASAEGRISIDIISFEDEVVEGTSEGGADIGRSADTDDGADGDIESADGVEDDDASEGSAPAEK